MTVYVYVDLHPEEAVGAERPGHVGEGQAGNSELPELCAVYLVLAPDVSSEG